MSIRDDQRSKVVAALSQHLLTTGLSQVSLRQLAAAAGVSDRMLLYYFPDKTAVLAAALGTVAEGLAEGLAQAIPADKALRPGDLIVQVARMTTDTGMRPMMRLWVQVVAAAAKGEAPYVEISARIVAGFQQWIESRLDVPQAQRKDLALAILALVDGLALVEICSGDEAATGAAGALVHLTR